jgi:hypothetical protein
MVGMMDSGSRASFTEKLEPLLTDEVELRRHVEKTVEETPVIDMHTHLFSIEFGKMALFGIDDLLTYHYLIAEMFRSVELKPERFWRMSKREQADLIWRTLFVENSPLSEAARGIVTILKAFGLSTNAATLDEAREFFATQDVAKHFDRVFEMARVKAVVMTNDPLDAREAHVWENGVRIDARFHAALRLDRVLNDWTNAVPKLAERGYAVETAIDAKTVAEVRRFLEDWITRMRPLYMAVSLPDDFRFPSDDVRDRLLREAVLPTARAAGLPLSLMIGVRRGVNPALRIAGDGVGRADVKAVERMCAENPDVRFFVTFLSRENQHELCVAARKFSNLMPFGCWWFLNNPSIVAEITRERIELLGTSFIAQHSDARILEQLIYKWKHSRRVIADALVEAYTRLLASGRAVTAREIERDVARLFSENFRRWVAIEGAP